MNEPEGSAKRWGKLLEEKKRRKGLGGWIRGNAKRDSMIIDKNDIGRLARVLELVARELVHPTRGSRWKL